eukprot:CAMPEP_0177468126 /NCGR_PEP_ID=MMETSP0369-20130122/18898_1 /TAXON_ID=447022 ORGANISM="Scrippsiella hangoei-like, Strain SHHI-4" /NCGR_SAMPLE_ID=MMETSP0369 /ASSEMBLY_ACC=CAM_ASM_000364 /LENGTH=58 /DNA_ID=CAMNT_0018942291 /DNA_START=96 /DNA_END=269 /DNA_ORIENTATION=-
MPERCPCSSRKHGILASDAGLQESENSVHAGRGEEANAAPVTHATSMKLTPSMRSSHS